MNLKDFLANRDKPPELLWALVMETGWVQAGIWYIGESSAEVISTSPPTAWETEEELIGATDAALSAAIQKLPEDYQEPSKTVFGVPSDWVKEGEISEEHLASIKKLCTDLSLNPVGFVVLPEAIAHLYKSEEGSPLSAIIVGLGSEQLAISVFKLGNLVGTTTVARSVSLVEDVTEGLTRFEGASPLPSRFIVFDGKGGELEEAKENLLQASWGESEKVKFLHTPKVEILVSEKKVLATSLAGANEIGNINTITSKEDAADEMPIASEVENVTSVDEKISAESLGFNIGEDVSANVPATPVTISPQQVNIRVENKSNFNPAQKAGEYFARTKSLFHSFSSKFKSGPKISGRVKSTSLMVAATVAVLGVVAAILFWWFYPKAVVTIYATPKKFEEETQVSFNTAGNFDAGGGIIPGTVLSAKVSGDKTKSATGSKLIGDKAKGTVKIGNSTPNNLNIARTFISSADNLKFSLDNSASVSAGLDSFTPGTSTVNVTAGDIGAQYNLANGETFKVGSYPKADVSAQATNDFSGGSSQQISAVSKDDQTSLESDLKDELSAQAKDSISSQAASTQIFVDDLAGLDTTSETFDHKVGDQADSIKLSLNLNATGIAADREKLLEYARGVLKDKIPQGYVLRDSQIDFKFTFIDLTDGKYNYKVTISANFLPEVNVDGIVKQISGKSPSAVETYLSGLPGFSRATISLKPHFPGFLGILPRVAKNISVVSMADQ